MPAIGSMPTGLRCCSCGAVATMKCGACHVSRYCSSACQRKHWPHHKTSCKVDRKNPARELETELAVTNRLCTHGARLDLATHAYGMMECLLPFILRRDDYISAEFSAAEAYARDHRAVASDSGFPSAIAARAVDAFLDKDILIACSVLKVAFFFEEYANDGDAFLRVVSKPSEAVGARESVILSRVVAFHRSLSTHTGILAALRARTSCSCLHAAPATQTSVSTT